jgi:acyl carrier protein
LLVELEQMFDIEIPDDYLMQGRLETYQDICNMIEELSQK